MPREVVHLYGRDRAIALVRECLTRPEHDGILSSRRTPVLIFTGSRGSGKTTLLADLARRLDQQTPCAYVDFQVVDANAARNVLTALAFEFNRKCGRYGALSFPRFITGQLIVDQPLTLADRKVARAEVERRLEAHRNIDYLRQFLKDVAPAALSSVPGAKETPGVNELGRYIPDLVLNGLVSWRRGRRVVLGGGQDWFGHQDSDLGRDAIDVLVDLNRQVNAGNDAESQREATELLWAAFLADLRHGFRHGRRADERSFNCAVLLDNADTPEGLTFLEELVGARRRHTAYRRGDPDPLTVVATSRGTLVERVTMIDQPAHGDDWLDNWWYPVVLGDLTNDDVASMVSAVELDRGSRRRVATMVHQFTAGHPASTRLVIDAIAERPADRLDQHAVLDAREPGLKQEMTVRQRLLHRFRLAVAEDAVDDLVTCAAARDINEAIRLVGHSGLVTGSHDERHAVFVSELWTAADATAVKVIQPPLRRLLLRELAERKDGDGATWATLHDWIRQDCARRDDEAGELYHALAVGEVEPVARRLTTRLTILETEEWLRLLDPVVRAPNLLDHQPAPIDELTRLTNWSDPLDAPLAAVARLTAALWLLADPLIDDRRKSLHLEIAADFDQIAPYSTRGLQWLRPRAEQHRAESAKWD